MWPSCYPEKSIDDDLGKVEQIRTLMRQGLMQGW